VELVRLEKGQGPSFRLIGELDGSNVPDVAPRLLDELHRSNQLILDIGALTFMDSQGLHMVIDLGREAVERGTSVTVVNSSRQVKRLLEVAVPAGMPGVEVVEADKT
jgi:anti-anti-sigma factor